MYLVIVRYAYYIFAIHPDSPVAAAALQHVTDYLLAAVEHRH
jgi:hypothetical protein